MTMTINFRIQRTNDASAAGQKAHDERIGNQPKYVDSSKTHMNSTMLTMYPIEKIREECDRRRMDNGAKRRMRSDAVSVWTGLLSFGKEAQKVFNALPHEKQNELYRKSIEGVADYFKTTVEALSAHRDESADHAHFMYAGVCLDGQPLSNKLNKEIYSEIQDIAASPFNEIGITRGEKKTEKIKRMQSDGATKQQIDAATVHRNVHQLHEDLPIEIDTLEQRLLYANAVFLEKEELLKKAQDKLEAIKKDTEAKNGALEKLTQRVETYERRTSEQQVEIETLTSELERKKHLLERVYELEQNELQQAIDEGRSYGIRR